MLKFRELEGRVLEEKKMFPLGSLASMGHSFYKPPNRKKHHLVFLVMRNRN